MKIDVNEVPQSGNSFKTIYEQNLKGSKKLSNYLIWIALSVGGVGFLLASASSYSGMNLLPLGSPSSLIFIPQGLVMGLYGIAASALSLYLWRLISIDFGSGTNTFDKNTGLLVVSRQGFLKEVLVEIPLKDIKAVKLDVREGFNSRRRIALRVQGRKDLPISKVGAPEPLLKLEEEGARLARFLEVNLEGI